MSFVHGKNTYLSLDGKNLSAFTSASELSRSADIHDVTNYAGAAAENAHEYVGGLTDGKSTLSGTYDSTAVTGPRAVINPLIGSTVVLIRRPEGTGTGKPQDTVDVVVKDYVETSPVADMVKWSAELQLSGSVVSAAQA
jgi:hypothetical protein